MKDAILMAVPVFFLLIGIELWIDLRQGNKTYRLADALCSLSIGSLSQITGFYTKIVGVALYTIAWRHLALFDLRADDWRVWVGAELAYDLCYYWYHRMGHEVNILWAAHVVHHSSEEYNLTTALRQTSTGFLFAWIFYLPMAVIGIPPLVFIGAGLINLLYQYWIHTRLIGRLGWFDHAFASPSNHRVHHGQNDYCIDRNYGGLLMLWDHLFGTFVEERDDEEIIYGIRGQLGTHDPLMANLHVYRDLWRDMRLADSWKERLMVPIKHPGWRPAAAASRAPKPDWSPDAFRTYRPGYQRIGRAAALLCFIALLVAAVAWLAVAPAAADLPVLLAAIAVTAGFWLLGRRLSAP
jgi:sterol desaturase/sphingolipid hydroxylase (fatty acid hydroxylase superfamily)